MSNRYGCIRRTPHSYNATIRQEPAFLNQRHRAAKSRIYTRLLFAILSANTASADFALRPGGLPALRSTRDIASVESGSHLPHYVWQIDESVAQALQPMVRAEPRNMRGGDQTTGASRLVIAVHVRRCCRRRGLVPSGASRRLLPCPPETWSPHPSKKDGMSLDQKVPANLRATVTPRQQVLLDSDRSAVVLATISHVVDENVDVAPKDVVGEGRHPRSARAPLADAGGDLGILNPSRDKCPLAKLSGPSAVEIEYVISFGEGVPRMGSGLAACLVQTSSRLPVVARMCTRPNASPLPATTGLCHLDDKQTKGGTCAGRLAKSRRRGGGHLQIDRPKLRINDDRGRRDLQLVGSNGAHPDAVWAAIDRSTAGVEDDEDPIVWKHLTEPVDGINPTFDRSAFAVPHSCVRNMGD